MGKDDDCEEVSSSTTKEIQKRELNLGKATLATEVANKS